MNLLEIKNGVSNLYKQYNQLQNKWIQENPLIKITCHKSCSNCCNVSLKTSLAEALVINNSITDKEKDLLRIQSKQILDLYQHCDVDDDYFYQHRLEIGNCVFLDSSGICSIHKIRPLACREVCSNHSEKYCLYSFPEKLSDQEMLSIQKSFIQGINDKTPFITPLITLAEQIEKKIEQMMVKSYGFTAHGVMPLLITLLNGNIKQKSIKKYFYDQKIPEFLFQYIQ